MQARTKLDVGKAVKHSAGDVFSCIAQLLSGRQIAAAAVVAASAGNVRLASLIAQVCIYLLLVALFCHVMPFKALLASCAPPSLC